MYAQEVENDIKDVAFLNESCHMLMSHVTHVNASCHI